MKTKIGFLGMIFFTFFSVSAGGRDIDNVTVDGQWIIARPLFYSEEPGVSIVNESIDVDIAEKLDVGMLYEIHNNSDEDSSVQLIRSVTIESEYENPIRDNEQIGGTPNSYILDKSFVYKFLNPSDKYEAFPAGYTGFIKNSVFDHQRIGFLVKITVEDYLTLFNSTFSPNYDICSLKVNEVEVEPEYVIIDYSIPDLATEFTQPKIQFIFIYSVALSGNERAYVSSNSTLFYSDKVDSTPDKASYIRLLTGVDSQADMLPEASSISITNTRAVNVINNTNSTDDRLNVLNTRFEYIDYRPEAGEEIKVSPVP